MKAAIVNLVTERYISGQQRLEKSLKDNYNGDFFGFVGEHSVGSPNHIDNPYAFKIYAIEKVKQMGYTKILWLDASVYAVKNVQPIFDWIEEKGFFMEHAGHLCGTWTNDETLQYFNITRDEAMKMPMYSAGFCGYNFVNTISIEHFEKWKLAMLLGFFKGSWKDHRHDMTCGSIIANQMNMVDNFSNGGNYFSYIGQAYETPSPNSIFHLQGL